jgi:hypothetical protein
VNGPSRSSVVAVPTKVSESPEGRSSGDIGVLLSRRSRAATPA